MSDMTTVAAGLTLEAATRWAAACSEYAETQTRDLLSLPYAVAVGAVDGEVNAVRDGIRRDLDEARREARWCQRALDMTPDMGAVSHAAVRAGVVRSVEAAERALRPVLRSRELDGRLARLAEVQS